MDGFFYYVLYQGQGMLARQTWGFDGVWWLFARARACYWCNLRRWCSLQVMHGHSAPGRATNAMQLQSVQYYYCCAIACSCRVQANNICVTRPAGRAYNWARKAWVLVGAFGAPARPSPAVQLVIIIYLSLVRPSMHLSFTSTPTTRESQYIPAS